MYHHHCTTRKHLGILLLLEQSNEEVVIGQHQLELIEFIEALPMQQVLGSSQFVKKMPASTAGRQ
jgi:hypothetical protein